MAQHEIRRATRSDFDAVMGIGEVYNGKDYLRYRYNSFLDDPNNRSYVYMVGRDMIGFSATFLIDGGLSLLSRGGRVKASFQGQGIFRTLKKYVRQQYQSIESVKYEVLTSSNVNVSARPSLRQSFTELSYKNLIYYATRLSEVARLPQPTSFPIIKEMTQYDMATLFSSQLSCSKLFPDGKVTVNWAPLRPMTSNTKYIFLQDSMILASTNGDNGDVSLLTIGTPKTVDAGRMYHIDIFGSEDPSLRYHVLSHLHHTMTFSQDDVLVSLASEEKTTPLCRNIMKTLCIHEHQCSRKKMYVFERDFVYVK